MRLSCNGCRVLRKGCGDNCTIRPCLQWISSPESQAHATLFLAKFYGRAGLINLINAAPEHLRPAVFRSLLYEACGRIVNPVYGSVGLLGNGKWHLCREAVDAVLRGEPINLVSFSSELTIQDGDIRHITKYDNSVDSRRPCKVNTNGEFKPSARKPKHSTVGSMADLDVAGSMSPLLSWLPSSGSVGPWDADSVSVETVEASLATLDDPADGSGVNLELSLG